MARIRDLLQVVYDVHGRDALDWLLELRGLQPGRTIDDKLERLARSYRGDMRAFIGDLRVPELRTLARELEIDGRPYTLLRSSRLSRPDFVRILGDALADRVFHPDLVPVDDGEDEAQVIEAESWWGEEASPDGGEEMPSIEARKDPFPRVKTTWSGPRQLPTIMRRLRLDVPSRLRTGRFQDLVARLRELGFEMCLEDDERVLRDTDETPGIHARVRLRRTRPRDTLDDVRPAPPRVDPVVIPRAHPLLDPPTTASASEYELALMRLELLTAVPSLHREHLPTWPGAFVDAAMRGLKLEPHHRQVLAAVAQTFRRGFHDFAPVAERLRRRIALEEWNALIDAFERLNADSADATHVIARLLRGGQKATVPRSEPSRSEPTAPPPRVISAEPKAAAPPKPVVSDGAQQVTDGRSMGALEDMFD